MWLWVLHNDPATSNTLPFCWGMFSSGTFQGRGKTCSEATWLEITFPDFHRLLQQVSHVMLLGICRGNRVALQAPHSTERMGRREEGLCTALFAQHTSGIAPHGEPPPHPAARVALCPVQSPALNTTHSPSPKYLPTARRGPGRGGLTMRICVLMRRYGMIPPLDRSPGAVPGGGCVPSRPAPAPPKGGGGRTAPSPGD